ncbi:MAG: S41 family peptidase [Acidobacteriota bacterium]
MKRPIAALFALLLLTVTATFGASGNVDLPRYPSISPDGSSIIFSWRGDLWKVPAEGGRAIRLTSHPNLDSRSVWSRDGSRIFFESDRSGFQNIHVMNSDGTELRQVSRSDVTLSLAGVGADDQGHEIVTFSSSREGDNYRSPRPFSIRAEGGEIRRICGAFGDFPIWSPDNGRLLFTRGGAAWTRRHYRGADRRDVWLYEQKDGSYRQLTDWSGNDGQARWGDDHTVYFLSDRQLERYNVYRMDLNRGPSSIAPITRFKDRDVWSFDVSYDGRRAVVQAWDTLYLVDLTVANAKPRAISVSAPEDSRDRFFLQPIEKTVTEAALSPDGQTMAFVSFGEIYVRNVADKSPTRRVTHSAAREQDIAWSPDGLKLYFVNDSTDTLSIYAATVGLTRDEVRQQFESPADRSDATGNSGEESTQGSGDAGDREGAQNAEEEQPKQNEKLPPELDPSRWHDAVRFEITPVVVQSSNDWKPRPSPDGRSLAFLHERGDMEILDLGSGQTRALLQGWDFQIDWRWSPDSRSIAYQQSDLNFNSDIWIVPADGSAKPVNISRHPNNDIDPRWSADGKILSFLSERINDEFDVWAVYLDRSLEALTPDELEQYYDKAVKDAGARKPLEPRRPGEETSASDQRPEAFSWSDLNDAYLRLRRITRLSGSESNHEMTPGGELHIFTGTTEGPGLFTVRWDGKEIQRIGDAASVQQLSFDGKTLVTLHEGRAYTLSTTGKERKLIGISDQLHIDRRALSAQKFKELARTLGMLFYHPTMKGLNWNALTQQYLPLAEGAYTADEFNQVSMRLLGELNGSHLGVYARDEDERNAERQGRLGISAHRVEGGYQVDHVIPLSPSAAGPMHLMAGDVILSVEGRTFGSTDTLESALEGQVGKETLLTIRRPASDDGETRELKVLLTPVSWNEERRLKYDEWRRANARRVDELSHGRIGYIHILGMDQPSLDIFERDLYAAADGKDGLIIDVRNNGGGWTTDRLLSSIMVEPHAYTVPRGADGKRTDVYPQDRLFIERYTLPIDMLCNEKSFSNAEIISHAFKTLKRGTLVGQETNGSVISTGAFQLVDGTRVRLPYRGWYLPDGTDMENHGAMPDLIVEQTPQAESRGVDEQLQAAVKDLLQRLD